MPRNPMKVLLPFLVTLTCTRPYVAWVVDLFMYTPQFTGEWVYGVVQHFWE